MPRERSIKFFSTFPQLFLLILPQSNMPRLPNTVSDIFRHLQPKSWKRNKMMIMNCLCIAPIWSLWACVSPGLELTDAQPWSLCLFLNAHTPEFTIQAKNPDVSIALAPTSPDHFCSVKAVNNSNLKEQAAGGYSKEQWFKGSRSGLKQCTVNSCFVLFVF